MDASPGVEYPSSQGEEKNRRGEEKASVTLHCKSDSVIAQIRFTVNMAEDTPPPPAVACDAEAEPTAVHRMSDAEKIADVKSGLNIDSDVTNKKNDVDKSVAENDEMMPISRAEWQKMMQVIEELRNDQKKLISDLAKANSRIKELERERNDEDGNASKASKEPANGPKSKPNAPSLTSNAEKEVPNVPKPTSNDPKIVANVTPTAQESVHPKKSWAEIAKSNRPRFADVSKTMQDRIRESRDMLKDLIYRPKPKPTSVYFRNIKRAQLGVVRKALRNMQLPPWALLGLSFIGQSVLEIVCDEGHVAQLTVKLRLLGASEVKNFEIFGDNLKKVPTSAKIDRARSNIEKAKMRLTRLVATSTNDSAKAWYATKIDEADDRLDKLGDDTTLDTQPNEKTRDDANDIVESAKEQEPKTPDTDKTAKIGFKYNAKGTENDNKNDSEMNDSDPYVEEEDEITPVPNSAKKRPRSPDSSDRVQRADSDDETQPPEKMDSQPARQAPPPQ